MIGISSKMNSLTTAALKNTYQNFLSNLKKERSKKALAIWDSSLELRDYCLGKALILLSEANVAQRHQLTFEHRLELFFKVLKTRSFKLIESFWSASFDLQETVVTYSKEQQQSFSDKVLCCENSRFIRLYLAKISSKEYYVELLQDCYLKSPNQKVRKILEEELQARGKIVPKKEVVIPTAFWGKYKLFIASLTYSKRELAKKIWDENLELQNYCLGKIVIINEESHSPQMHQLSLVSRLELFCNILKTQRKLLIQPFWEASLDVQNWCMAKEVDENTRHQTLDLRLNLFKRVLLSRNNRVIDAIWQANPDIQATVTAYNKKQQQEFLARVLVCHHKRFIREYLGAISETEYFPGLLRECYIENRNKATRRILERVFEKMGEEIPIRSASMISSKQSQELVMPSAPPILAPTKQVKSPCFFSDGMNEALMDNLPALSKETEAVSVQQEDVSFSNTLPEELTWDLPPLLEEFNSALETISDTSRLDFNNIGCIDSIPVLSEEAVSVPQEDVSFLNTLPEEPTFNWPPSSEEFYPALETISDTSRLDFNNIGCIDSIPVLSEEAGAVSTQPDDELTWNLLPSLGELYPVPEAISDKSVLDIDRTGFVDNEWNLPPVAAITNNAQKRAAETRLIEPPAKRFCQPGITGLLFNETGFFAKKKSSGQLENLLEQTADAAAKALLTQ